MVLLTSGTIFATCWSPTTSEMSWSVTCTVIVLGGGDEEVGISLSGMNGVAFPALSLEELTVEDLEVEDLEIELARFPESLRLVRCSFFRFVDEEDRLLVSALDPLLLLASRYPEWLLVLGIEVCGRDLDRCDLLILLSRDLRGLLYSFLSSLRRRYEVFSNLEYLLVSLSVERPLGRISLCLASFSPDTVCDCNSRPRWRSALRSLSASIDSST